MILFFVILSVLLALIILVIFVVLNINTHRKFVLVKYIDNCKYPTIIGLTKNGLYTNIINNPKDKILIAFLSGDEINGTYLNPKTFQLTDKDNVARIIKSDYNTSFNLFAFNFNICINSPYRITSLISKITYITDFNYSALFYNDLNFFAITSLSPLIINIIDHTNFTILKQIINLSWINSYGSLSIKSNPILINGIYWVIGTNNNKLVFILLDLINKLIINSFSIDIDFDVHFGLIYNKLNDTFSIPIFKNNKIHIFNILKNSLYS